MNRVLKVVFSRAKGMFVVVSELGRACTKGSLKSVLVAVPMALAATGAMAEGTPVYVTAAEVQQLIDNALKYIDIGYTNMSESANASGSGVAIGTNSKAYDSAVAIGAGSESSDIGAVAIGNSAEASANYSVAIGDGAIAYGEQSVALGEGSLAYGNNTVSVGSFENQRKIVNVANGTANTDAATVGQVNQKVAAAESNANSYTDDKIAELQSSLGSGVTEDYVNTAVAGAKTYAADQASAAVASANSYTDGKATELNGKITDAVSTANSYTDGQVNDLNGKISNNSSAITNLQNNLTSNVTTLEGKITDAVSSANSYTDGKATELNGKIGANEQAIIANQNKIGANEQAIAANRNLIGANEQAIVANQNKIGANEQAIAANQNKIGANEREIAVNRNLIGANEQAIATNTNRIAQNAQGISNLNRRVGELDTKVKRTGATAAALAGLRPLDYSPDNPFSASASLGHYDGKQALAVGMFMRPTENFMVGLGASTSGSRDVMMNLGVSYRFGGGSSYGGMTKSDLAQKVVAMSQHNDALDAQLRSANIREEASVKRLNRVQKELKAAQKKAELSDQKLDMVMKELAALREEIQKMKQK